MKRTLGILIGGFCFAWIVKAIALPVFAYFAYKDDFIRLSSLCANAMDESWFAEQFEDGALRQSTDVHLMVCHEYDKLRKKLLVLGLSEDMLSLFGLEATETYQRTVSEISKPHRFLER